MATATSRRRSNFASNRYSGSHERPRSSDQPKEQIWTPMLEGVSSGKRLPEKSLLVLGGNPETQREFLESVSTDPSNNRRPPDRGRKPPTANQFALGYTYQDVLDADHDDTLARLSLYLLANPSPSFTPLIKPYLTPKTLPNMLIVILLDWSHPWLWLRQLYEWIRVLRALILSLDDESKMVLQENIDQWQDKGRGLGGSEAMNSAAENIKVPLGPGEGDEHLGIPLCVVCQNADKIETLERERGWKEEEFDFILQYMRTILLKHGASLVYTMPSAPGSLQTLIHSTLGIKSLLKQKQLKHNVIDRDRVLVPPNWDSWGKIRILREGFDVEGVSKQWTIDIDNIPRSMIAAANRQPQTAPEPETSDEPPSSPQKDPDAPAPTVSVYEETIRNPEQDFPLSALHAKQANGIELATKATQDFLSEQTAMLEQLRREDEQEKSKNSNDKRKANATFITTSEDTSGVVEEHIGPVQFNMGGIQVNADEMVKRLQDREANRTSEQHESDTAPSPVHDPKLDNDKLASFFAGLMNKGSNAATGSPRPG